MRMLGRTLGFTRPTRQVVATLAVVAFLIAPTVVISWWSWQVRRPSHRRSVEADLSRRLGLTVRIGEVRYPRPGAVMFTDVEARHLDRDVMVARARRLRMTRGSSELTIEADDLAFGGESPRRVVEEIPKLLRGLAGDETRRVTLVTATCQLSSGPVGVVGTLSDFALTATVEGEAVGISTSARLTIGSEDGRVATRCEATWVPGGTAGPSLTVATKEGPPLPARVLAPFFEADDWLGSDAKVQGRLVLKPTGTAEWEAEFRGVLTEIDLGAIVAGRFPDHHLTGRGRLDIRSARWGDRGQGQGFGWVSAEGTLTAGPGAISRSLVDALGRQLGFLVPGTLVPLGPDLPYVQLGLAFTMGADGALTFRGGLGAEHPRDAVLIDGRRPVPLISAPRTPGDIRGLVKALFPVASETPTALIPGTLESQRLQRYLPLPPSLARRPETP